jgi:hypothetical protein
MLDEGSGPLVRDAETEFRARLTAKLQLRGYHGAELEQKIEDLLRKGVKLRLDVPEILKHLE